MHYSRSEGAGRRRPPVGEVSSRAAHSRAADAGEARETRLFHPRGGTPPRRKGVSPIFTRSRLCRVGRVAGRTLFPRELRPGRTRFTREPCRASIDDRRRPQPEKATGDTPRESSHRLALSSRYGSPGSGSLTTNAVCRALRPALCFFRANRKFTCERSSVQTEEAPKSERVARCEGHLREGERMVTSRREAPRGQNADALVRNETRASRDDHSTLGGGIIADTGDCRCTI